VIKSAVEHEAARPAAVIAGSTAAVVAGKCLYDRGWFYWVKPTMQATGRGVCTAATGVLQAVGAIKAGHVAAATTVAATAGASYGLYQAHPALAALPPAVVSWFIIKAKLQNNKFHQDAAKQAALMTIASIAEFPLVYINKFTSCGEKSSPEDIQLLFNGADSKLNTANAQKLKSELASLMKCENTDADLDNNLRATIDFIIKELADMRNYTNIEDLLIPKAQIVLKQTNPVEPDYFKTTDALLHSNVFSQLDTWCTELQANNWADKFFAWRTYVTKACGVTVHYPGYSSITYNGASKYVVELLKQLGRLQAIKKVVECHGRHSKTRYALTETV
jgi:hypothetical protein